METQVGFKMAKWINQIEFIDDYSGIGHGLGAGARTTSTTTRTWRSDMPDPSATRPELIDLQSVERERVSELVAVKGGHCAGCGGRDFAVGHALYLGFLFLDEDDDAFMVALTCHNDDCPAPRTGIVLAANEFCPTTGRSPTSRTSRAAPGRDRLAQRGVARGIGEPRPGEIEPLDQLRHGTQVVT